VTFTAKASRYDRELLAPAEEFGFRPRLCRPYRAKTKGKVERFYGYLKGRFLVPLAATLKQVGLKLDVTAANSHMLTRAAVAAARRSSISYY
jgi:transposase